MKLLLLQSIALMAIVGSALLLSGEKIINRTNRFQCTSPSHPDYEPLMALYNATNGDNWDSKVGWGIDCDVCLWEGILCDKNRVIRVQLGSNNLSGTIPPEIGQLDSLKVLQFFNNNLSGEIPEEVFDLPNLMDLNLSLNSLTGTIPSNLHHAIKLEVFRLASNIIDGTLPPEIGFLPNIIEINLNNNEFTGPLPSNLGNAESLVRLSLANNELSGAYPEFLGQLVNLTDLNLSNNNFQGDLPSSISALSKLRYLNLSNNPSSITFPSFIGDFYDLESLWMINAGVMGSIPPKFSTLSKLKTVRLEGNRISRFEAQDFNELVNLRTLYLSKNQIQSLIPSSIGNAVELYDLRLDDNQFFGPIPESIRNLTKLRYLYFNKNALSGKIPNDLQSMTGLHDFRISENSISGEIPAAFSEMKELRILNLSKNNLIGNYPSFFSELPNLVSLNLSYNKLENCIPETYRIFCDQNQNNFNFFQNCTFENPTFMEFCSGASCNNSLNLSTDLLEVCEGATFDILAPGGYSQYTWSVGSGSSNILQTTASSSQYYYLTITNSKGCEKKDSIYIQVLPRSLGEEYAEICSGIPIVINGETFTSEGVYSQTISRIGECDSTVIVTILEGQSNSGTYSTSVCPGSTVLINGEALGVGLHTQIITNSVGCDSSISILVSPLTTYNQELDFSVCEGETYKYQGQDLSAGHHVFNYQTIQGCDSIVTVNVISSSSSNGNYTESICQGSTAIVNGEEFGPGQHSQIIANSFGCDSIITIDILLLPVYSEIFEFSICEGGSYNYEGQELEVGDHTFNYQTVNGCDSMLSILIQPIAGQEVFLSELVCEGQVYELGDQSFYSSGNYQHVFKNAAGCDSIVNLHLSVASGDDQFIEYSICEGESYTFAGTNYWESIHVSDSVVVDGCKSWVTLDLSVYPNAINEFSKTICDGEFEEFYGQELSQAGIYNHTLKTSNGCDSTVILELSVLEVLETFIDTFICEQSELEFDGEVFSAPGLYRMERLVDGACVEITNLKISVYESEKLFAQEFVCYGDVVEFYGIEYGGGQYTGTIDDGNCMVEFELTVAELAYTNVNEVLAICPGESIEFMGESYFSGGQYYLGQNIGGCQILNNIFVLEASDDSQITPLIFCSGEIIPIGDMDITSSGKYPVPNSLECSQGYYDVIFMGGQDSIIEKTIRRGQTLVINQQVFDSSGFYEILMGEDIECLSTLYLDLEVQTCEGLRNELRFICEGEMLDYLGNQISEAGIYEIKKALEIGCDSIISLVVESSEIGDFEIEGPNFICEGDSIVLFGPPGYIYEWNDLSNIDSLKVDKPGSYFLTIYDENGCSKTSSVEVDLITFPQNAIDIITTDPSDCTIENGSISIESNDGRKYLYSIDGGLKYHESSTFENLPSGAYRIVLADPNLLCSKELAVSIVLEGPGIPGIDSIAIDHINPCLGRGGSINISPSNTLLQYEYSIDGGESWQASGFFIDLDEGSYKILIKDLNTDCENNLTEVVEINVVPILEAEIKVESELTCSNSSAGVASVVIKQGQAPFKILWSSGDIGFTARDLMAGTYSVSIEDFNGCQEVIAFDLQGFDLSSSLAPFEDSVKCEGETISFDVDTSFIYKIYKEGVLYYSGKQPEISEPGTYEVVIDLDTDCQESKTIIIEDLSIDQLGIDFLLSTEAVTNVEVVAVNISSLNDTEFNWLVSADVDVTSIDEFSQGFTFKDTGTYLVTLNTVFNGCDFSFEKTIIVYPDSTYLSNPENLDAQITLDGFGYFKVFPSPNDGNFEVEIEMLSKKLPLTISIFDVFGSLVEQRRVEGLRHYLEAFSLKNAGHGVYSVIIQVENKVFSKSILILR